MMISTGSVLRSIAVLTLAAVPALCASITYTSQASWAAATAAGYLTINFEGLTGVGVPKDYSTALGLSLNGVNFVGVRPTDYYLNVRNENTGNSFNFGSGAILVGPWPFNNEARHIQVNLPINITSVGFEVMTINAGGPVTVKLSTNETFTVNTIANTRTFIGFTSDTPLTSVQVASVCTTCTVFPNGQPAIDNFAFGAENPATPEIGTLMMIGTGLVLFRIARKRKWRWASADRRSSHA